MDDNGNAKGHAIHIYKQLIHREENGENNYSLFEKDSVQIKIGDSVRFYTTIEENFDQPFESKNVVNNYPFGNFIEFKQVPEFKIKSIAENEDNDDFYVAMRAEDLQGRSIRTRFFKSEASPRPEPPKPTNVDLSNSDDKTNNPN